MGEEGSSRQIKQMVAFILQEAEEKCKEIKIKVGKTPRLRRSGRWLRNGGLVPEMSCF